MSGRANARQQQAHQKQPWDSPSHRKTKRIPQSLRTLTGSDDHPIFKFFFETPASRETMRVASMRALRARRGGGRPPVKLDNVRILYEGDVIRKYIQFRSISCEESTQKRQTHHPVSLKENRVVGCEGEHRRELGSHHALSASLT